MKKRSDDERKAMFANMNTTKKTSTRSQYKPPTVHQPKKSTTQKEYIYGDFDNDGVKNIDDPYPFDPDRSEWPDPNTNPTYYYQAQYGGFDTKMSEELQKIEEANNRGSPMLKETIADNPGSYGRVKTVPSTIGKMRKKSYTDISDTAGATIVVETREDVMKEANRLKSNYKIDPSETDDFYSHPKDDVYYAYHLGLIDENNGTLEVQIKTRKMKKLHEEMHEAYKRGESLEPYRARAKELYRQGY